MSIFKIAIPCEACGQRLEVRDGRKGGTLVGMTTKGARRVIHNSCRRDWNSRFHLIMARWPELRLSVFGQLPKYRQGVILQSMELLGIELVVSAKQQRFVPRHRFQRRR